MYNTGKVISGPGRGGCHYIQLLSAKESIGEYDELKIYDDAFKNYSWVKVLDDNIFAIIMSFSFVCV